MHSLIITAHPSSKGFTHKIASTYKQAKESIGSTAEIVNLYDVEWKQDFVVYEEMQDMGKEDPVRTKTQELIKKADEIVVVFPVWWGESPAILKNWLDKNFTHGFAFTFENGKPKGLLQGKTARMFATSGAPSFIYSFFPIRLANLWGMLRLGYCGMKFSSSDILGKKESRSEAELNTFLEKVASRAKQ